MLPIHHFKFPTSNKLLLLELLFLFFFFFFNDTATTEIYTLSLHDALPIFWSSSAALTISSGIFVVPGFPASLSFFHCSRAVFRAVCMPSMVLRSLSVLLAMG